MANLAYPAGIVVDMQVPVSNPYLINHSGDLSETSFCLIILMLVKLEEPASPAKSRTASHNLFSNVVLLLGVGVKHVHKHMPFPTYGHIGQFQKEIVKGRITLVT